MVTQRTRSFTRFRLDFAFRVTLYVSILHLIQCNYAQKCLTHDHILADLQHLDIKNAQGSFAKDC